MAMIPSESGTVTVLPPAATPVPAPAPVVAAGAEVARPLSVGDALGYLDAVKREFETRPDVYNKFLDIMKDFKSTAIDTPGVIERVSELFFGNSELIEGFNTFLPQGYHINAAPDQPFITVVTPQGTIHARPGDLAHEFSKRAQMSLPPQTPPALAAPLPYSPGSQAATVLNSFAQPASQSDAAHAVEFSRAIQFLNKIKTRFPDDPDTYKVFLDILGSYRVQQAQGPEHDTQAQAARDQRLMQDVFKQVATLFRDQTELVAEFKEFLPAVLGATMASAAPRSQSALPPPPPPAQLPISEPHSSPIKSSTVPAKRPRKPPQPKAEVVKLEPASAPVKKRPRVSKTAAVRSSSKVPQRAPSPPPAQQAQHQQQQYAPSSSRAPPMGEPAPQDDLAFFESIRRSLDSREAYDDLLRLLALYARDVLSPRDVLDRAADILPPAALSLLANRFGADVAPSGRGPPGSLRSAPPPPVDLPRLPPEEEAVTGPSYRAVPPGEARLATSGRDALARSVLNDALCSHPTWQSEETAFGAHKRNAYEEQMHRCEDERHEFAIVREGLARTLAVLAPLALRLDALPPDARAAHRLRPGLGGPSPRIYERTLKKIYGRDAGAQVLQELQDAPGAAVPVVLARLRAKDAEWRKAQREWEPTWRAVDARNFYKSLDSAGASFKANDKKAITAKALVAELEGARRAATGDKGTGKGKGKGKAPESAPAYPMLLGFEDAGVLDDALRLVAAFLEHAQGAYAPPERRAVERFLRVLVAALLPPAEPPTTNGNGNGHAHVNGNGKHAAEDEESEEEDEFEFDEEAVREWVRESVPAGMKPLRDAPVRVKPFFANTTFYTLLRLLHLLYSRLLLAKAAGAAHAAERFASLSANPTAVALGLDDALGAATQLRKVLAHPQSHLTNNNPLYAYLLGAAVCVFEGDLEQAVFEEHARWFVGPRAHALYTLDKLCGALAKQASLALSDARARELWALSKAPRAGTRAALMRYRRAAAERLGPDENLFRAEWDADARALSLALVAGGDASVGGTTPVERWREYVDSFVLSSQTELLPASTPATARRRAPVFLKRAREPEDAPGAGAAARGPPMAIRVSLGTYALFYEAGAEECLLRVRSAEDHARAAAREEERRRAMGARWGRT